ncbi:MAG: bacteriohemerythrin [Deltaproteobacteria bacterium]|nr:MAG: bacteriohemerythrin [Deltaproteobacteria bacterium]
MAIEWTEELATGVAAVDRQHREIFSRYSQFLGACKSGKGREGLLDILAFLVSYVESHFAEEEKLMREVNYPDAQAHADEHRAFRKLVLSLREQVAEHGPTISLLTDANRRLLDWLVDHIKKSDRAMGGFVRQQWGLL